MKLFQELDKLAYDIEQEYEQNKHVDSKKKRQYIKICELRDKLYAKHLKNIRKLNKTSRGVIHCAGFKSCTERIKPQPANCGSAVK